MQQDNIQDKDQNTNTEDKKQVEKLESNMEEMMNHILDKLNFEDKTQAQKQMEQIISDLQSLLLEDMMKNETQILEFDEAANDIEQDQTKLDLYQQEIQKLKQKFDELWINITKENEQKLKNEFKTLCENKFQKICKKFEKFNVQLNQQEQQEKIQKFLNSLNMKDPKEDDSIQFFDTLFDYLNQINCFELILNDEQKNEQKGGQKDEQKDEQKSEQKNEQKVEEKIEQKDVQKNEQKIEQKDEKKNEQKDESKDEKKDQQKDDQKEGFIFEKNFNKEFKKKIESCLKIQQILPIIQFYNYEIELKWIANTDLENYLKTTAADDLQNFCKTSRKKEPILQFLEYFNIFGYYFDNNKLEELKDLVLVKKEKNLYDYCQYKEISIRNENLNIASEFSNLICQSKDLKTEIIKAFNYEQTLVEFNEKKQIIINKKQILNGDLEVNNNEDETNSLIFNFLIDCQKNKQNLVEFQKQIQSKITQLMNDQKQYRWKKIYSQIHEIILLEYSSNDNQLDLGMINIIMDRIKIKIREYNICFSNYGVILSDQGQKVIYDFVIFIIWTIQCYLTYQSKFKIQNELLCKMEIEQFEQFSTKIKQNINQQSNLNGKVNANIIINTLIKQNQTNISKITKDELVNLKKDPKMTNSYLINELDNKLLNQKDVLYNENNIAEIFQYVNFQTKFIEEFVNQRVKDLRNQYTKSSIEKFQENLSKDLNQILNKLTLISQQVSENQNACEYFLKMDNSNDASSILYQIIMKCLVGSLVKSDLDNIKDQYKSVLENANDLIKIDILLSFPKNQKNQPII
ncbi:unnamed protein product [Paramecium sonneborni]|uniref:Uncharacterized protein n=1 Tax=Paramecium sonneborni TaxID=65129 RepID=A0A8S1RA43_9CILI|nr:unnamed protein product [Paramecium sonneborni]